MIPLRDTIPSKHTPFVTILLIMANCGVFFLELVQPPGGLEALFFTYGIVPVKFSGLMPGPEGVMYGDDVGALSFLSSMFLHGGWMHLISNMWILWIFGDNVEDRMGSVRFLVFYILSGVAAGAVHLGTNLSSPVPTVGASGAIAGVMGAYFLLFPSSRVVTIVPLFYMWTIMEIPAFVFLGFWFVTQFFSGAASLLDPGAVGGIAWWAHIGGFAFGLLLHNLFVIRTRVERVEW